MNIEIAVNVTQFRNHLCTQLIILKFFTNQFYFLSWQLQKVKHRTNYK